MKFCSFALNHLSTQWLLQAPLENEGAGGWAHQPPPANNHRAAVRHDNDEVMDDASRRSSSSSSSHDNEWEFHPIPGGQNQQQRQQQLPANEVLHGQPPPENQDDQPMDEASRSSSGRLDRNPIPGGQNQQQHQQPPLPANARGQPQPMDGAGAAQDENHPQLVFEGGPLENNDGDGDPSHNHGNSLSNGSSNNWSKSTQPLNRNVVFEGGPLQEPGSVDLDNESMPSLGQRSIDSSDVESEAAEEEEEQEEEHQIIFEGGPFQAQGSGDDDVEGDEEEEEAVVEEVEPVVQAAEVEAARPPAVVPDQGRGGPHGHLLDQIFRQQQQGTDCPCDQCRCNPNNFHREGYDERFDYKEYLRDNNLVQDDDLDQFREECRWVSQVFRRFQQEFPRPPPQLPQGEEDSSDEDSSDEDASQQSDASMQSQVTALLSFARDAESLQDDDASNASVANADNAAAAEAGNVDNEDEWAWLRRLRVNDIESLPHNIYPLGSKPLSKSIKLALQQGGTNNNFHAASYHFYKLVFEAEGDMHQKFDVSSCLLFCSLFVCINLTFPNYFISPLLSMLYLGWTVLVMNSSSCNMTRQQCYMKE